MGRPSWLELAGIAALGVFGALWGLSLFLFRDPSDPHWAEFAFGFMGVASAVAVSMLIVPLHWWLRHHYRGKPITGEELLYLTSTQPPDMVAFATGWSSSAPCSPPLPCYFLRPVNRSHSW